MLGQQVDGQTIRQQCGRGTRTDRGNKGLLGPVAAIEDKLHTHPDGIDADKDRQVIVFKRVGYRLEPVAVSRLKNFNCRQVYTLVACCLNQAAQVLRLPGRAGDEYA